MKYIHLKFTINHSYINTFNAFWGHGSGSRIGSCFTFLDLRAVVVRAAVVAHFLCETCKYCNTYNNNYVVYSYF